MFLYMAAALLISSGMKIFDVGDGVLILVCDAV
jgi:hypothetical protein